MLLDLVGYQIDWEDIQVASQVNGISGLVNGGEATSHGLEASRAMFRPVDGLTLGLNARLQRREHRRGLPARSPCQTSPGLGDIRADVNTGLAGDRMPYVPDLTWSATADYYLPLTSGWGVNFGGGFRWVDDRTNGTTHRQVDLPGEPADGSCSGRSRAAGASTATARSTCTPRSPTSTGRCARYMKNATDERAYSTMDDVTGQVTGVTHHIAATPIQPRMFGFEVDYRF